ncbi:MAG TPA: outer membrane beta-barrel protein, partial [Chitinophagaceae bacterium]|nr:outer membrane beta-barrel protein [Chitinophagaceae bacterium]
RVDDANMLTSFQLGFIGNLHLGSIAYLQPGIIFTGKGSKTQSGSTSSANYFKATSNPFYVELPANLILKLPLSSDNRFFVGAGPYLGVGVSGKNKVEGKSLGVAFKSERKIEFSDDDPSTFSYEENAGFGVLKRFDYGLNGTAGIEGKGASFSLNYGYGLAKISSGTNGSSNDNNKHRVLSLLLGIKL